MHSAQLCPELGLVPSGCPPWAARRAELLGPPTEQHRCRLLLPAPGGGRGLFPAPLTPSARSSPAGRHGEAAGRPPCSRVFKPPRRPFPGALPEHPPARGICGGCRAGERKSSAGSARGCKPTHPAPRPRTPAPLRRPPGRQ